MEEEIHTEKKRDYFLPVSILISGLLISGSILLVNSQKSIGPASLAKLNGQGGPTTNTNVGVTLAPRDIVLGDPKAPVTLIEYGDYQCPFCARFFSDTESLIREDYIKTGKVKMVYREFPLDSIHPYARSAAEAARCAKDQGKYWAYHDALFDRQAQIPNLDFVKLAGELGLETAGFKKCVESRKYKDEVQEDLQDGIAAGVQGTPTTFINGKPLFGAQPYTVFKEIIDQLLADLDAKN